MYKYFIAALAAAAIGAGAAEAASSTAAAPPEASALPDNAATPGRANPKVTQSNIRRTICNPRWVKSQLPPTRFLAKAKTAQLQQASAANTDPARYEIDHRVPIEVGGHPRARANLWAQPLDTEWNALVKNKLDTYVAREVCAGRMRLAEAQAVFQRDWVDVFRTYCGPEPGAACNPPGTQGVTLTDPKRPAAPR